MRFQRAAILSRTLQRSVHFLRENRSAVAGLAEQADNPMKTKFLASRPNGPFSWRSPREIGVGLISQSKITCHDAPLRTDLEMTAPAWSLRRAALLDESLIEQLAGVLIDCVEGDASVSFMHPLTRERAVAFWRGVAEGMAAGDRVLLIAEDSQGVCGTVQLGFDLPENQPHRADVSKMLVHRRARRQGLGTALMRAVETAAVEYGKTLLVLDAVTGGDAARLYQRLGWIRVGDIPGYALMPRGGFCSTTVFCRDLRTLAATSGNA
jgi:GNAT superfamily N-acetyltransferase